MFGLTLLPLIASLVATPQATPDRPKPIDLKVLYIGNAGTMRAREYEEFLKRHFASVQTANRATFQPSAAGDADVVLLDWSQSDRTISPEETASGRPRMVEPCPLGPRESWKRPTVLLGSAGLLITGSWETNGSYGCTCLFPFAHNWRAHEVFQKPIALDCSHTIKRPVPNDTWRAQLHADEVDVIPLAAGTVRPYHDYTPGWCTYEKTLAEGPDIEFMCGGPNDKGPDAVGLWRQGHLLHFGYDLSPDEMTDFAKGLLVNSIAYISRFTQDQAIVRARSGFEPGAARSRDNFEHWLSDDEYPLNFFEAAMDHALLASIPDRTRAGCLAWYRANRKYLHPGPDGLMVIDPDIRQLDIAYDKPEFFKRSIAALRDQATQQAAASALHRYAPEGPKSDDPDDWSKWHQANAPYLFYSEWAGYRWYIDPLAKTRGIPTADLRGPVRADR